jgi:hypothetical protein
MRVRKQRLRDQNLLTIKIAGQLTSDGEFALFFRFREGRARRDFSRSLGVASRALVIRNSISDAYEVLLKGAIHGAQARSLCHDTSDNPAFHLKYVCEKQIHRSFDSALVIHSDLK